MYNVSQDFIAAIREAVQVSKIKFSIGNTAYTEDNILKDSFSITNQCTDTEDITLGAVYTAELTATLRGVNIARNYWKGKVIVPTHQLKIASDPDIYEDVPLGKFIISEATWTHSGVDIVAYDNMSKFDKPLSLNQSGGYLYDFLDLACDTCHVELGNTQADINSKPNGNTYFNYRSENDSETWRDLISWIAQMLGGFATIGRDGKLYIRNYSQVAVDSIDESHRSAKGQFSDYITKYTGISYVDIETQTTIYTGAQVDDGATMIFGANPFLQKRQQAVTAIAVLLDEISKIQYTPFRSATIGNPAYDLGDVITFTGGLAGSSITSCIQKYVFDAHKQFEFSGYGANPELANARSKLDKDISGIIATQGGSGNVMRFYEYRNVADINIGAGYTKRVVHFKLASNANTRVQIIVEINLTATDTDNNDLTFLKAVYVVDGDEMLMQPQETYIDGHHVLHLMYILPMLADQITYFDIKLMSTSGTISIPRQGVWAYASGVGIVGDGRWDGELDLEDDAEPILLGEVAFGSDITENVSMRVWSPIGGTLSDNLASIGLSEITVKGATERVLFNKLYLSEETWTQAYAHTWANVYQNYIWGRIVEEN